MRISSRSRIAINAMLDVAMNGEREPVALVTIGERMDVSLSYLEQLFRRLREHGLVKSARGPGGGYRLARSLKTISVADIVDIVDDEPQDSRDGAGIRASEQFWEQLDRHLIDYLRTVTLESILKQHEDRAPAAAVPAFAPKTPAHRPATVRHSEAPHAFSAA
jgi:Rrf2 family iron-sulfur cluster assembly transcriptional regulator